MVKRRIYSFQMDGESRAEAICRAFQQYTLVDWALYDRVSFQIVSSVKYPLVWDSAKFPFSDLRDCSFS